MTIPRMSIIPATNGLLINAGSKPSRLNRSGSTDPNSVPQMAEWVKAGNIKFKEQIIEGLENTPAAFLKLFDGTNTGKLMVKL